MNYVHSMCTHMAPTTTVGRKAAFCMLLALPPSLGVSLKTQQLYLLVFLARYGDLLWTFISVYNR